MNTKEKLSKWFKETDSLLRDEISDLGPVDGLCESVLHSTHDYCEAILSLLADGHVMPGKALLRCLWEVYVKLSWCLHIPDDVDLDFSEDKLVARKIRRWEKDTLYRNVKILEGFRGTMPVGDKSWLEENIDKLKQEPLFSDHAVKNLPPLTELIHQLPEEYGKEGHPFLYLQFNSAVHLDVQSLVDNYPGLMGKVKASDLDALRTYCVINAFWVNATIRLNYGQDITRLKNDYDEVVSSLSSRTDSP